MEVREAIKKAGGGSAVSRYLRISRSAVSLWAMKNKMPISEWTGRTSHTAKIAELAALLNDPFAPIDVCPLAGQYMQSLTEDKAT